MSVKWPTASSRDAVELRPVVLRAARLEIEAPVRAGLVLVRHPDAAGVDDPLPGDDALVLRVDVPADDHVGVDVLEEERDPLLGRALGEDVDVVPRRRVDVERARRSERSADSRRGTRSAPR